MSDSDYDELPSRQRPRRLGGKVSQYARHQEEEFDDLPPEPRSRQSRPQRQEPKYDFDDDLPPDLENSRSSKK